MPIPKRTAELQSGQRAALTEHRDRTESAEMNLRVCNRCHDDSGGAIVSRQRRRDS